MGWPEDRGTHRDGQKSLGKEGWGGGGCCCEGSGRANGSIWVTLRIWVHRGWGDVRAPRKIGAGGERGMGVSGGTERLCKI